MTAIIGISAFYHDSAAALIINGEIIGAAQEERFSRIKHDANFPHKAIKYLLEESKISFSDIKYVVFYEKPFLKFERILETYVANAPKGFKSFQKGMPIWIKEKIFQKSILIKELKKFSSKFKPSKLMFAEHHLSHAASAFYPSPFDEAVILTIDGVGEWATTTVSIGKLNKIKQVKEIKFPHSLGLLYSAFTYYLGFKVNSGEYKVMGLAPYGKPKYKNIILDNLIDIKEDGSFFLNQKYFNYTTGLTMINDNFCKLFKTKVRLPEKEPLNQFHMDIASSIQVVIEEIIIKIVKNLSREYNTNNLCLAGGVALNCVANSKVRNSGYFKNIWVQPAAGDAGGSLGASLLFWHNELNQPRIISKFDTMKGAFLGPAYKRIQIEKSLIDCGANFEILNDKSIISKTVKDITEDKAIGWFQERMEFGPRSLGNRSIIADPRSSAMQKDLNLKIKFRESFRPFAPSILVEDLEEWFESKIENPYMLFVYNIKKNLRKKLSEEEQKNSGIDKLNIIRSEIPAVTHVDYSARVQTVDSNRNPKFYKLIKAFKDITGCPIIINTSFNVRGEPIVCTPEDAYNCFMGTNLDTLVIGNFYLSKKNQNKKLLKDYKNKYELD